MTVRPANSSLFVASLGTPVPDGVQRALLPLVRVLSQIPDRDGRSFVDAAMNSGYGAETANS
ncbi:hypothetical protein [Streptomyces sp. NPDC004008]